MEKGEEDTMTDTLLNVLGGFSQHLEVVTRTQSIVSIIIIAFFAWFYFNTWTGTNNELTLNNPPRHFTTFSRYIWFAFIYTMTFEFVYIIFLFTPGLFEVVVKYFSAPGMADPNSETYQSNSPLWLLVFLIAIVPNTPGLKKAEIWIRGKLHKQAFIPAEAEALVNQFIMHPARFESDPDSANLVTEEIKNDIPHTEDITRPDRRLRHNWFKINYLRRKINEWKTSREIIQYFDFCKPLLEKCEAEYTELRMEVRSYYANLNQLGKEATQGERNYFDTKKLDINKKLDLLLKQIYEVICCGVLATQKTHHKRLDSFHYFGFKPDFTEGPPIYVDIILGCVFLSTILTFATTYIFHNIYPTIIKDMTTIISWTAVMLLLQGASILVAVTISRRLSMKKRLGNLPDNNFFVTGPITNISIGTLAGYVTGFAIIIMYVLLFSKKDTGFTIDLMKRTWPWPMIPAATSCFIIYYLESLDVKRKRLTEGIIQGLAMAVVAGLAYTISAGLRGTETRYSFLEYSMLVCGLTGFAIGWIFPEEYRRRKKASLKRYEERRSYSRILVMNTGKVQIGDETYPCQTIDLSLGGAKLSMAIPQEIGTDVLLNLDHIGEIKGVIKRKEENRTSLKLFPNEQIKKRLAEYIGLNPASLVYA